MDQEKRETLAAALVRCKAGDQGRCMVDLETLQAAKKAQVNEQGLEAAREKYLQLGREAGLLPEPHRDNLEHTHSKLGIFLELAFGVERWRAAASDKGSP